MFLFLRHRFETRFHLYHYMRMGKTTKSNVCTTLLNKKQKKTCICIKDTNDLIISYFAFTPEILFI